MDDRLIAWLACGERGISSNTIVQHLTGIPTLQYGWKSHPHDPGDLMRCRKLLRQVPLLQLQFRGMASASPEWAALVEHWDSLCAMMDAEAPEWEQGHGSAPLTYKRMQELFDGAKRA